MPLFLDDIKCPDVVIQSTPAANPKTRFTNLVVVSMYLLAGTFAESIINSNRPRITIQTGSFLSTKGCVERFVNNPQRTFLRNLCFPFVSNTGRYVGGMVTELNENSVIQGIYPMYDIISQTGGPISYIKNGEIVKQEQFLGSGSKVLVKMFYSSPFYSSPVSAWENISFEALI